MLYLFDPITCEKKPTTYSLLEGITGYPYTTLMSYKSRKIKLKSINCYLIDENTKAKELIVYLKKEVIEDEVWRNIPDSNSQVSSYGRYRRRTSDGYTFILVTITKKKTHTRPIVRIRYSDGKRKEHLAQLLVCKIFISERPHNKACYHKDSNIWNNRVENLTYKSKQYIGSKTGGKTSRAKAVFKIDPLTDEVIEEYDTMAEAGRDNYTHRENIRCCIIGKQRTAAGFKWRLEN